MNFIATSSCRAEMSGLAEGSVQTEREVGRDDGRDDGQDEGREVEGGACKLCMLCLTEIGCKRCGKCSERVYCSKSCQCLDWKFHKLTCSDKVKIQETEACGKGVYAKQDFRVGDELIRESPLFVFPCFQVSGTEAEVCDCEFQKLNVEMKRVMLQLANVHPDQSELMGIIKTNGIPLGADSEQGGIFARTSRINHACKPNARYIWRPDIGKELVFAIRPIAKGDEITVCYLAEYACKKTRQKMLQKRFNFTCRCPTCEYTSELHTIEQDEMLPEIQKLYEQIPIKVNMGWNGPFEALKMSERILSLKKKANLDTPVDMEHSYYDAYQMARECGNEAKAKKYLSNAYECAKLCEGKDSPQVLKYAKLLALNSFFFHI